MRGEMARLGWRSDEQIITHLWCFAKQERGGTASSAAPQKGEDSSVGNRGEFDPGSDKSNQDAKHRTLCMTESVRQSGFDTPLVALWDSLVKLFGR